MTITEIASLSGGWPRRIASLRPKHVVELGTGQGASGAKIMEALPKDSRFTTINYADGHNFGEQLQPWDDDPRLTMLAADTLNLATLAVVPDGIDFLFMDTIHEAWHVAAELRLWQLKLVNGAIVIVDDLNQHDMVIFWNSLPYEKALSSEQGVFRYDTELRYHRSFEKPAHTTYGGKYA